MAHIAPRSPTYLDRRDSIQATKTHCNSFTQLQDMLNSVNQLICIIICVFYCMLSISYTVR